MPFNTAPMFLTYHSFLFDHLFDILNTRNPCTTGFKAALRVKNKSSWDNYIEGLKDALQNPMYTTKRKTGFVGFFLAIKSVKGLFHDLVEQTQAPMNYLLTFYILHCRASISYIAGYIGTMTEKKISCMPCCKALGSAMHTAESSFLKLKDRGYLFKPTTSVLTVCEETKKCFQRMLLSTGGTLPHCMGISDAIANCHISVEWNRSLQRFQRA